MNPNTTPVPIIMGRTIIFLSFIAMTLLAPTVAPQSGVFNAPLEVTITDWCPEGLGHSIVVVDQPAGSYSVDRLPDSNGMCVFQVTFRGPAEIKTIEHWVAHSFMDGVYSTFEVDLTIK